MTSAQFLEKPNRISPKVTPINVPFGRVPPIFPSMLGAAADAALRARPDASRGETKRRRTT